MRKQLEIATIKASSTTLQEFEIYWLFSRNQLEFVFREVEMISSPSRIRKVRYEDELLPVVKLERYYGLEERRDSGTPRYFVVRTVAENKELVRLVVESAQTLKIHKLETGFASVQSPPLPKNSENVLGMYSLAAAKLAVVPDFAGICRSLQL